MPSLESVELLEQVAAGSRQSSDLIAAVTPPDPPPYDAETLGQRIRSDSRAVQLMTLWQAEGGLTPGVAHQLNAMVVEDGGIQPVLNGFFYMTAVLVHMISAVIGVDPQGFIGGLLDVYATQPYERQEMLGTDEQPS